MNNLVGQEAMVSETWKLQPAKQYNQDKQGYSPRILPNPLQKLIGYKFWLIRNLTNVWLSHTTDVLGYLGKDFQNIHIPMHANVPSYTRS